MCDVALRRPFHNGPLCACCRQQRPQALVMLLTTRSCCFTRSRGRRAGARVGWLVLATGTQEMCICGCCGDAAMRRHGFVARVCPKRRQERAMCAEFTQATRRSTSLAPFGHLRPSFRDAMSHPQRLKQPRKLTTRTRTFDAHVYLEVALEASVRRVRQASGQQRKRASHGHKRTDIGEGSIVATQHPNRRSSRRAHAAARRSSSGSGPAVLLTSEMRWRPCSLCGD